MHAFNAPKQTPRWWFLWPRWWVKSMGNFFRTWKSLLHRTPAASWSRHQFGAVPKNLRTRVKSENNMNKLVFPDLKQFNIKLDGNLSNLINQVLKANIWMWKMLFVVAHASDLHACMIFIQPCSWVCLDTCTVTSTQTWLLRSALTLGQRPSKHTFP